MKRTNPTLLLLLCCVVQAVAQDAHYWTAQYGTKSMLLSGSVVGGVEDLGAVYYNPGRLAVISNAAFLLSASVYEYNSVEVDNAFENNKKIGKSEIKGVPTLAAGTFKIKKLPNHHFAYAVMTRQSSDLGFSYRNEVHKDVIGTIPGQEYFGAEIGYVNNAIEQWIGLTWSHALSEKLSVGVTTNFTTNNQNKGFKVGLQALSDDAVTNKDSSKVAIYRRNTSYNYKSNGLLWKVGLAGKFGEWNLGLTVTTPMVMLSGSGNYTYEEFLSKIPNVVLSDTYITSYQEGLELKVRTPFSVGFGATRNFGRNKIHFSTEYYSAIPNYTMMTAKPQFKQSKPTDTLRFNLVDELKSVWNAGIGWEFYISEHVSGFASFSTDFSSVAGQPTRFIQNKEVTNNSQWNADFYNAGGGVVISLKGADITLGATHTGGHQKVVKPVNFPDNPNTPIFGGTDEADLYWDRWRFVFSFSLPFLQDYAKKLQGGKEGQK